MSMSRKVSYPYLTQSSRGGSKWFARMNIPADVRGQFGDKRAFIEPTGEDDPHKAYLKAAPWIESWKRQIREARGAEKTIEDNVRHFADTLVEFRRRTGLYEERDLRIAYEMYKLLMERVQEADPKLAAVIENPRGAGTPFLAHLDGFKSATHLKGKTLDQVISDLNQFADQCPEPLEILSGKHVQTWIDQLLNTVSALTIRRKLTGLRTYWNHLQAHEIVSTDRKPFDNRIVNDRKTKVEKTLDQRQRFEIDDIKKLIANTNDDLPLKSLITLAIYTGARREGLASLTTKSIIQYEGIDCLSLTEKTAAGVRLVPIHTNIRQQVHELAKQSRDGFLLPSEADKYGHRGDHLGKRFTALKTSLGFDHRYAFHSIRHTVIHLFRVANCPLEIRNQIVGHEDGSVGAGYGGHIPMTEKLMWMEKALIY